MRRSWWIWLTLTLLVGTGTAGYWLSATPSLTELILRPGSGADLTVFRLRSSSVRPLLEFGRENNEHRPELGEWRTRARDSTGSLYFENPGAPVKLRLSIQETGSSFVFAALPAGSYGPTIDRDLTPYRDMGDPHRFLWQPLPDSGPMPTLSAGMSHLHVDVIEVGEPIIGEKVTLLVRAPVSLKSIEVGYGIFWWFGFWPIYAAALLISGLILLARTIRASKLRHQ
jgi:hypothetical protein